MTFHTLLLMALVGLVYGLGQSSLSRLVKRIGRERHVAEARIHYVNAVLSGALAVMAIVAVCIIAGVGFRDLGLLAGSLFAVIGVALFAQWSILSNVTASIIVFFFFPYRVGDQVRIIDGENTISGRITEITLFHVIMAGDGDELITFPNALAFQRAVVINPAPRPPLKPAITKTSDPIPDTKMSPHQDSPPTP